MAAAGCDVVSIEVRESLHKFGGDNLKRAKLNVKLLLGDGALGAPEHGPFDAIVLACTPNSIPQELIEQLVDGGRLVGPEGDPSKIQTLVRLTKIGNSVHREAIRGAWFVPMVGANEHEALAVPNPQH